MDVVDVNVGKRAELPVIEDVALLLPNVAVPVNCDELEHVNAPAKLPLADSTRGRFK